MQKCRAPLGIDAPSSAKPARPDDIPGRDEPAGLQKRGGVNENPPLRLPPPDRGASFRSARRVFDAAPF
jgi:hypothetical protein